jgi:hypothetical protein
MPDKSVDEDEALTLQRRDLEEAVGDAWENMAKLHWEHENDSAKAETCLQKSLQFFPYQARDGVQAIQRSIEAASRKQKDERQGTHGAGRARLGCAASSLRCPAHMSARSPRAKSRRRSTR